MNISARALVPCLLLLWSCRGASSQSTAEQDGPSSAPPSARGLTTASAAPASSLRTGTAVAGQPAATPSGSAGGGPGARRLRSSEVRVIEVGRAPLRPLRYRFAAGVREQIELSTRTKVAFAVGRKPPSSPATPVLKLKASVDIREVGQNGVASRALRVESIMPEGTGALDPGVREDLEAVLGKLRAFQSLDQIDDRGIQRGRSLSEQGDDPEARVLMETLSQAFGHMSAPLPLEPVGVGARWEVESELSQQGIALQQLTTYELVSLDSDGGRLALTLTQRAPGGRLGGAGFPLEQAEIVRLQAAGDGELRFQLARSMPSGHIESTSSVLLRTRQGGHAQDVSVDTSIQVRFEVR